MKGKDKCRLFVALFPLTWLSSLVFFLFSFSYFLPPTVLLRLKKDNGHISPAVATPQPQ